MKGSDYIARFIEAQGVNAVFEMSGGMITHILDSLARHTKVRIVSMHHEQAAAFAADAYGRMTGVPGVAMATSGPGATNLLTGIGSCHFDSSPAVFITGQVNRHEQKGDRAIRQLGFQETEIVPMAVPITKASWQVRTPEELPQMFDDAFSLAVAGRPGPVLLDVPMDIQRTDIDADPLHRSVARPTCGRPSKEAVAEILRTVAAAKRPLILAGGGVRAARCAELLRELAAKTHVPVVTSLMAVDAVEYRDAERVGLIGSYGNRWANLAIGASDLLLVLGSRLDVRQTGSEPESFKAQRTIIHVDCEPGEMNNRVTGCTEVLADLREFLEAAVAAVREQQFDTRGEWHDQLRRLREQWPDTAELPDISGVNPNSFMHQLSAGSQRASAYVVDVGQHQMWAAQSLEVGEHQRFLTSGGMGSMGFALPAAIGVAITGNGSPVVMIAGDGGFQSNIQELQTVMRNGLPIKMVIINNNCHGMVRQFQESYFDKLYQSTLVGYSAPDFARVAEAYGIPSQTVAASGDVDAAVRWLWSDPSKPALLQVMVDTYTNAYPKMAFGRPHGEMEPFATPIGMEGT
jgi:acetolactate synthase-1/2/3 large subunit